MEKQKLTLVESQKSRNKATLIALGSLCLLFYFITIVKMIALGAK